MFRGNFFAEPPQRILRTFKLQIIPGEATMCEIFSKQKCILCPSAEDMRGLAACPKIQKSIFSNRIFGFRSKRWIFGFPRFFFRFFWILRKGAWIFGFPSQKSKKTRGKRWISAKIQLLPTFFWIFLEKSIFFLEFFGFLISGLE